MNKQGFAIDWTAEHIRTGYETAYAVGEDRALEHMEHIEDLYENAEIVNVREIPANRAVRMNRKRGAGW